MHQGVQAGADVIVFPELFLTGPTNGNHKLVDFEGRYRQRLQRLAAEQKIDIVTGSLIEGDQTGLHNTTYYIDRHGEILGQYHKINLWQPERQHLKAGSQSKVFNTTYGRVGLSICWDIVTPGLFRQMAQQGVELVFCPSYWCAQLYGNEVKHDLLAEKKHVDALCVTRAFENEIIFAYCNAAGKCAQANEAFPKELIGHTQITVPFRGALQCLEHNSEEMLVQEIDTEILQDAEDLYGLRKRIEHERVYH